MRKRSTTFTKGSGVYACEACHRATRDDGNGDSVNCQLCTQCYALGGIENAISDEGEAALNSYRAEAREHLAVLKDKGASLENWADLMAKVGA